jgi:hypothetical protein
MPLCLVQFFVESSWKAFRHAELDSLLVACGVTSVTSACPRLGDATPRPQLDPVDPSPFLLIDLPDFDVARRICERSVLIKHIYELWAGIKV